MRMTLKESRMNMRAKRNQNQVKQKQLGKETKIKRDITGYGSKSGPRAKVPRSARYFLSTEKPHAVDTSNPRLSHSH
ncbi:hypothetical protein L2E82_20157 [Cichorium intybus]|uniref:Uncharacterized protein n=1 Tax=Cichorium intybus TaxID=13427 RepID=A0ACB9DS88_CICIN|nr:hypothetical protein L2E82_20157 [Cichorium intybus]